MDHLSVFFGNPVIADKRGDQTQFSKIEIIVYSASLIGNVCFMPCAYLFNTNMFFITRNAKSEVQRFEKVLFGKDKTFIKTALAIALLIPGIVFGTLIKGLTYLHKSMRENHRLILLSKTPIERIDIGSKDEGVNLDQLQAQVKQIISENRYHRSVKAVVIYATPLLSKLNSDYGILDLSPEKIILVGGVRITTYPSIHDFDKKFIEKGGWEMREAREGSSCWDTLIVQQTVKSVEEALADNPPRKSRFSEPLKQVYVVAGQIEDEAGPSVESF